MYPRSAPQLSLPAVSRSFAVASACLALLLTACGGNGQTQAAPRPPNPRGHRRRERRHRRQPLPARGRSGQADARQARPSRTRSSTRKRTYVATVKTNCGTFEITLDAKRAPKTGGSFKFLADQGFYDGLLIHRIVPGFVFQGGDPEGTGAGGPGYTVVEAPPKDLKYDKYVVAMAKTAQDPQGRVRLAVLRRHRHGRRAARPPTTRCWARSPPARTSPTRSARSSPTRARTSRTTRC